MPHRILVTGITGFVGSHCALDLLQQGYRVRGSIRDESRGEALCKMFAEQGADLKQLELVTASLTQRDHWDAAVADCHAIFHVASPVHTIPPKDPAEVIEPAKTGTLNVLSAAKSAGVQRVILTSSLLAIVGTAASSRTYSSDDWSDLKDQNMTHYALGKTIAEREAWAFCEEHDIKLTTINPGLILGPALEADYGTSLELLAKLLRREVPLLPKMGFEIVDVRDVASLHRLALENDVATGQRLIAANGLKWFTEVAQCLAKQYPEYRVPTRSMPNWLTHVASLFIREIGSVINQLDVAKTLDNSPALALGWQPRSPEEAILSGAQSLIRFKQV